MPVIHCTQKLLAETDTSPTMSSEVTIDSESPEFPLDEWYANLIVFERRKCVVFINPATLFVTIAYGKQRQELRHLPQVFMESLRQALLAENVEAEVIDRCVQRFEHTQIAKTQDRKTLGCLNDTVRHFKWMSERERDAPETRPTIVVRMLNRIPWVKTSFGYALVPMEQILHTTFGWQGKFDRS